MKRALLCVLMLAGLPFATHAQTVTVRGSAAVNYQGQLTPEIKNQAIAKARLKAVEKWFADAGEAEMENFDRNLPVITSSIDTYTDDPVKLNEQDDVAGRRYSVAVRVDLNVARLRNVIKGSSNIAAAPTGAKSKIVFVFVGREVASVKTFDDRVVKQGTTTVNAKGAVSTTDKGTEGENISANAVSTTAARDQSKAVSSNKEFRTETGGSTVRRSAQVERAVFPTNDLDVSIKGSFSQAGFDTRDAAFILSDKQLSTLTAEFANANKASPASLKAIAVELQKNGIPYFAIATLDVGREDIDPATGQPRVAVSITGEVYDLTDWPPRTIAAVGPVTMVSIGPDPDATRKQALKKAATDGTRELVSRMNVAGIR